MLQPGDQSSTTSIRQPSARSDTVSGWVIFSVLATFGLVDSVAMLATGNMGFSIGLGWNKTIFALFNGLALASSASSKIYFMSASFVTQLGVIGLFVLFAYLAWRRSFRSYVTGTIVYISDGVLAVVGQDFATASVHVLGLIGLLVGLAKLRGNLHVVRGSENDGSTDISELAGSKWLRSQAVWVAVGCGGLVLTTVILTVVAVFSGIVNVDSHTLYADMEQRILHRAPADLTEAEREQLQHAMKELAELENLGHVNTATDHDIRQALTLAAAGEKPRREDILRVIRVVGEASERARRPSQEDQNLVTDELSIEP